MNYRKTVEVKLRQYPSLFLDEYDLLHHLFFVIGNGYEWVNGELSDGLNGWQRAAQMRDSYRRRVQQHERMLADLPSLAQEPLFRIPAFGDLSAERALTESHRRMWIQHSDIFGAETSFFLAPDGSIGQRLYPLCEYARIMRLPDDIQPDWLEAATRAAAWARSPRVRMTAADESFLIVAEARIRELDARRSAMGPEAE